MESLWSKTTDMPAYPPLRGELRADVAVIGGGMAGILIAYFLAKAGLHPVVLEAERIGSGQTKNTTAKITSQHGLLYARLVCTGLHDLGWRSLHRPVLLLNAPLVCRHRVPKMGNDFLHGGGTDFDQPNHGTKEFGRKKLGLPLPWLPVRL